MSYLQEVERMQDKHRRFGQRFEEVDKSSYSMKEFTRFEVIDETGRVYTKWNCNVELQFQDEGRSLKVFVGNTVKDGEEN